jgi:hypothetical protein
LSRRAASALARSAVLPLLAVGRRAFSALSGLGRLDDFGGLLGLGRCGQRVGTLGQHVVEIEAGLLDRLVTGLAGQGDGLAGLRLGRRRGGRLVVLLGFWKGDDEVKYSAMPAATSAPRIRPTKMPTRVLPRLPDLGFLVCRRGF